MHDIFALHDSRALSEQIASGIEHAHGVPTRHLAIAAVHRGVP